MNESSMFKFKAPKAKTGVVFELVDEDDTNIDELLSESPNYDSTDQISYINDTSKSRWSKTQGLFGSQNTEHPLESIEKYERMITSQLGDRMDVDSKFVLTNFKSIGQDRSNSIKYNVLDIITNHCFPNEYGELPRHNNECWGGPECMAILPSKYIAIGTTYGKVLIFDYGLTSLQAIGTDKEKKYGAVTAMDISAKDETLVCGYQNGNIVLWVLGKNERLKTVKPSEKCSILSVKFWKDTRQHFIASTTKGSIYSYKTEVLLKLNVDRKLLFHNEITSRKSNTNSKKSNNTGNLNFPDGFFSIQILPKEHTRNLPLDKFTLVAFGSMKQVVIIALEPSFSVLGVFERPGDIDTSVAPCISWGKGALPGNSTVLYNLIREDYEENQYPLLALSWGKNLNLLRIRSAKNSEDLQIKNLGCFFSQADILHVEWLSENNLLVYDSSKELKVLFSGDFRSISHLDSGEPFDYSQAVINRQLIDAHIRSQVYEYRDSRTEWSIQYYTNTIKGIDSLKRIFIMGDKKMFVGKHFEWDEYLQDLTNKAEWLGALSLCVDLFKGTMKKFSGLPNNIEERKKAVRPISAGLIKAYIGSIYTSDEAYQNTEIWSTIMLTAIDFLVSVENYEDLFGDIKSIFEQHDFKELFMNSLEPFILRNKLLRIPREDLADLIKHYVEQGKGNVVQFLLLNLPLEQIDFGHAIVLCMQYNLLTSLMYLCSQSSNIGEPDFITPISKALCTFQQSLNYEKLRLTRLVKCNSQEDGIRFLWFLKMMLDGNKFPNGKIPEDIWVKQLKDLLVLLFEETNIDLIIRAEPYVAFEIFKSLFASTLTSVIQSFKEDGFQQIGTVRKSMSRTEEERKQEEELCEILQKFKQCFKNTFQGKMLGLIYYCGNKNEEYQNHLYYMLAELIVFYSYDLPMEVMEKCTYYLIQFPRTFPPWEEKARRFGGKEEEDGELEEELNEERSVVTLELIKKIKAYITSTKLEKVTRLADQANFIDIRVHLLGLKQEYRKGFELYLNQHNNVQKYKVFKWLDQVIPTLKETNQAGLDQLKEAIVRRLEDLIIVDSTKARKIMLVLDKNLEIQALYRLESFPKLQLEFLERILTKRDEGQEVPEDLLVLHVKLLCKKEPRQVLPKLKAYTYPLDECIKICREYRVQDALAFLLEQAGSVLEAVQILVEVFMKSVKKKLNKLVKENKFNVGRLTEKFDSIEEVCLRHTRFNDRDSEKMWFIFLDEVLEFSQKYITNSSITLDTSGNNQELSSLGQFIGTYSDYVSSLFNIISKHVPVESLITRLQRYKGLTLGDLKASLDGIIQTYHYERHILKDTNYLLKRNINKSITHIYNQTAMGICNDSSLFLEGMPDEMLVFECGHAYPKSCIEAKICVVCSYNESIRAQSTLSILKKGSDSTPKANRGSLTGFTDKVWIKDNIEAIKKDQERVSITLNHWYSQKRPRNAQAKESYLKKLGQFDESIDEKIRTWDNPNGDLEFF